jgi:drug/metabolite transporter (DMT)-like permease
MQYSSREAYGYAGLAIFFWSTVATAFKLGLRELTPFQLILFASLFSTLVLALLLLTSGKLGKVFTRDKKKLVHSMMLGLLNPFLYYLILFKAYNLLPAQVAQSLNFTWPLVLVLLGVPLMGRKLSSRAVLALLVSFTGVIFIASKGGFTGSSWANPLGVGLALISTLVWAFFWIMNMKDAREESLKLFLNFFFGSLFLVLLSFFVPGAWQVSLKGLALCAYTGFFEMGITFVFWLKALQLAEKTEKISNLIYLTPFVSLIFIHFVLREPLYYTTFIGLVLIVAGIFLQQSRKEKKTLQP